MDWLYILLFIVVVTMVLANLKRGQAQLKSKCLFKKRDALFTAAERSFLGVLDQATCGRYRVFAKVRVADVLTPATNNNSQRVSLFNKISAKHFDFVLCDPGTMDVKLVVELNDKSHRSKARAERDKLLRDACNNAGLALVEVPAKRGYSLEVIRRQLDAAEGKMRPAPEPQGRVEPSL